MFLNICKQTFHISHMWISQKVIGVLMWNLRHNIFIWRQRYWQILNSASYLLSEWDAREFPSIKRGWDIERNICKRSFLAHSLSASHVADAKVVGRFAVSCARCLLSNETWVVLTDVCYGLPMIKIKNLLCCIWSRNY